MGFRSTDIIDEPRRIRFLRGGLLCLAICLLFFASLSAQKKLLPVFHFQQVQGLPSVIIYSNVVRDSSGFVWIGTYNGLFRYDGYALREYRFSGTDPYSVPTDLITSLHCDRNNRLWVGTSAGKICIYDRFKDRFVRLAPLRLDTSNTDRGLFGRFLEERNGDIWVTTGRWIFRIRLPAQSSPDDLGRVAAGATVTPISPGDRAGIALCSLAERDGIGLIVGTDSGLTVIDPQTLTLTRPHFSDQTARRLNSLDVSSLVFDQHGTLWVATSTEGLFRLDWERGTATNYRHRDSDPYSIRNDIVWRIAPDPRGYLWISSYDGVDLFSPQEGRCIPYLASGTAPTGGPPQIVSSDYSGTVWFCTGAGVHWLSPNSFLLPHYSVKNAKGGPSAFESVDRDSNGGIWSFAAGQLLQLDSATRTVTRSIDVWKGKSQVFYETRDLTASLIDKRDNFWYASYDLGLYKVDLETYSVKNFDYRVNRKSVGIRSLAKGPGDSLWIGTEPDGLFMFDPVKETFTPSGLNVDYAVVFGARDSTLYVTTIGRGLVQYQRSTGKVKEYVHKDTDAHSLSDNVTRVAYEDPSGRVWIGGKLGLDLFHPELGSFTHFPNRLFERSIFAMPIGSDPQGLVWVRYASPGGLSLLDPTSGKFTNFSARHGLCGSPTDMLCLSDGRVLLTGTGGINILTPETLTCNRQAPPLVLTRARVNDSLSIPIFQNTALRPITFFHDQNVIEFEFAAIDIDAPGLVTYAYRLDGLEPEWIAPVDRRYVRYTALSPANYTFRVKAASSWGEWPEQELAFAFVIAPPWWRSSWAYACYFLLGIALLLATYRVRLNQIRMQQRMEMEHFHAERLVEVDRLKSRFFSNISHEFRTPLTLILGPAEQGLETEDLDVKNQKFRAIAENARRFLTLVNQLLDFSRLESGSMRLGVAKADMVPFLSRIVMSFESWAERKKIDLIFHADPDSMVGWFDAEKFEKIMNNLVSNALKFTGEGGTVAVKVSESRYQISDIRIPNLRCGIEVADTGPGIAPEHLPHIFDRFYRVDDTHVVEGTGIGLALTKELVELHHGTIAVRSARGEGSVFTLTIPIDESSYTPEEIVVVPPAVTLSQQDDVRVIIEQTGSPVSVSSTDGKPIALVVEDNADLRTYMRECLEPDYTVLEAENGKIGCERAMEIVPDILISDVMMPGLNGMELCRIVKKDVRTSHVPVILLTARAGTDSKIEGLECGADDYVTKPFDMKELLARVRNLIDQREELRKKFSAGVVLKLGDVAVATIEDELLRKIMVVVENNIGNEEFGVDELANDVGIGRRQLSRKLNALTNLSPAGFVQYVRLQRAHDLLERGAGTVAEIAFQVGFRNPTYFSTVFHKRFGCTPSEAGRRAKA